MGDGRWGRHGALQRGHTTDYSPGGGGAITGGWAEQLSTRGLEHGKLGRQEGQGIENGAWRMDGQRGLAPQPPPLVRRNGRLAGLIVEWEREGTDDVSITLCQSAAACLIYVGSLGQDSTPRRVNCALGGLRPHLRSHPKCRYVCTSQLAALRC